MENETRYLTRIEAAAYARVNVRTITRWLTEGHLTKIPGRRGRRAVVLIKLDELNRLMDTAPLH